jgi:hypothetical protein
MIAHRDRLLDRKNMNKVTERKVDKKEEMNTPSSRRRWRRESHRRSGAPFLQFDACPSEVRKRSVEESAMRKGDELVSHRSAAAVGPSLR